MRLINKNLFKHPIKHYMNWIKHSVIPKPYSHQVSMNILIRKGQQEGTALIPCTIYAMDHSIDLNPALVRKKDKKIMKYIKPKRKYQFIKDSEVKTYSVEGNKIYYNPNNYIVELTEDEKTRGYTLKELERCDKCHQKLVISEVRQTRYRSCPSIKVRLGDAAKEDTIVPVEFGVNKSDITRRYWLMPLFLVVFVVFTITMLTGYDVIAEWVSTPIANSLTFVPANHLSFFIKFIIIVFLWGIIGPVYLYQTYRLFKWYNSVKKNMKKTRYGYY